MIPMQVIKDMEYGGERPLYAARDLYIENVTVHAGESALKETANIEAVRCVFEGKYPFWETRKFKISECLFREGARAALWYSRGLVMEDTLVEAPKMFREMEDLSLTRVRIPHAAETLWRCRKIRMRDVTVAEGDYFGMSSSDIDIDGYTHQGNYAFQFARDIVIRHADIDAKDAFWQTENVTVIDSRISGEYLGWYSKNLRLVNCRIAGTQPLCYADGLVLENCVLEPDADLAFEYSDVRAGILSPVTSVKNPRSGQIIAQSYGEVIRDGNAKLPDDCDIFTWNDTDTDLARPEDPVEA